MRELQMRILHDLKKIACIISDLDFAVGILIGDLDDVVKGGTDGNGREGNAGNNTRNTKNFTESKK